MEVRHDIEDPTGESRKQDHIDLAFKSQVQAIDIDDRFSYEPILSGHPQKDTDLSVKILDRHLAAPIWVSSMTGGTEKAVTINENLARACGEYGLGMGLGSCRSLLYSDDRLGDFNVRRYMPNQPLYANLGVAQVEELILGKQLSTIDRLIDKLAADGLIIHVNPMQEWMQPEGDIYTMSPLDMIEEVLQHADYPIIVKEVGQGLGKQSLEALLRLPIQAIDFAASGGTNFALLELLRSDPARRELYLPFTKIGHTAVDMTGMYNDLVDDLGDAVRCSDVIISGGIKTYLDGYYLINKIHSSSAVYGQASAFLTHALGDYEELQSFVENQIDGLKLAKTFLKINT